MAPPTLDSLQPHVDESPINGVELFELGGEFDAFSAPALEQQLLEAIARGRYEICIDMSGVTFVDMSTLNVLVRAIKRVYQHNGHLVVVSSQGAVLRAIDLAGLRRAIRVFPTRQDAVDSLHHRAGGRPRDTEVHQEHRRRLPSLRLLTRR